jgi:radical SAM protein with 4Fe4S-binding SPASM domain
VKIIAVLSMLHEFPGDASLRGLPPRDSSASEIRAGANLPREQSRLSESDREDLAGEISADANPKGAADAGQASSQLNPPRSEHSAHLDDSRGQAITRTAGTRLNSATRHFRTEPVLAWTLHRLGRSAHISGSAVLCWEDQLAEVEPIAVELNAFISVRSPRISVPPVDSVSAARRWSDGWRGSLLGACEFDRGFYGPWILEIAQKLEADAVLLVDPAAALVDAAVIDAVFQQSQAHPEIDFCFSPAAPGLGGVLLKKSMLDQLAKLRTHPGTLISYRPDLPQRDLIGTDACAIIPAALARTMQRFTLDSDRQIEHISTATVHLNGELISTESEQLLLAIGNGPIISTLPRECVLELNANRNTLPIFSPLRHISIQREPLPIWLAKKLIDELAVAEDSRLTIAGVGDPLLHPNLFEILNYASSAGIAAISLETDLIGVNAGVITMLAESAVDIVSVHLPATSQRVYLEIMGVDALRQCLENIRKFVERRVSLNRGTPLLVPTFVKCNANFGEMESWYDHWMRLLGSAVIAGPTDYAGQVPDVAMADMSPPKRKACNRISSRVNVLCDGSVVACEQDILSRQILGNIRDRSIGDIWKTEFASLRKNHREQNWACHELCGNCREWHRP